MDETNSSTVSPAPAALPQTANRRKVFLLGVAAGALTASLAAGGLALALGDSEPDERPAAADSKPSAAETTQEVTEEPAETYNDYPTVDEFTVDLKTTSKQCFGSAGCNVTVEPELSYDGTLPLDPDKTYSITYEVRGGADGAIVQTMELTDQDSVSYRPVAMSTNRSSDKLTAEVADVEISE